ncbi:MAG: VWA domain-containing protein [Verrucomicrobiota bacterium]
MKNKLYPMGLIALAALLATGCEKSSSGSLTTSERQQAFESPMVTAKASKRSFDQEPIANTTPPGSKMDPSSNVYIVFDGSGSMTGQSIEEAKSAVAAFIAGAPDNLNIGLFVFDANSSDGREVVALGRGDTQRKQLATEISQINAGGGTPLGAAIQTGTKALIAQFQKQLRYGDVRLVVVTDGRASDQGMFNKSITFARDYHVPIYTIGFHIKSAHPLRQYSEAYFSANDEQELLGAMKETLAELDDSAAGDL